MISMAASAPIVNPADPKTRWVFKTPQNDSLMADAVAVHMRANGAQTMGFIGFADAYGDSWLAEMKRSTQTAGIKMVDEEKYNRNDPSVTGQVLKLLAARPDAILIAGSGTPAATPHKELIARGYKGGCNHPLEVKVVAGRVVCLRILEVERDAGGTVELKLRQFVLPGAGHRVVPVVAAHGSEAHGGCQCFRWRHRLDGDEV